MVTEASANASSAGLSGPMSPPASPPDGTATLTIAKAVDGAPSGTYSYSGDLGAFAVDSGNGQTFTQLTPGTYTIVENLPQGQRLQQVGCDTTFTWIPASASLTVTLQADADATCTFTNTTDTGPPDPHGGR